MRGGIYGCMARRKMDREFTMELAAHLELLTAEYVRNLGRVMMLELTSIWKLGCSRQWAR